MRDLEQACREVVERIFPYDAPFKNDLSAAILSLAQRIQREAVEACCDAIEDRSRHWEGGHKVAARKLLADLRATPPTEGKGRCRYCGTNGDHYCPNDIGTE